MGGFTPHLYLFYMNNKVKMAKLEKVAEKRKLLKSQKYRGRVKWGFYLPAFLTNIIFGWYPLIMGFIVAFQAYYFSTAEYVGFANFNSVIHDPQLIITFKNTFYYTALSIGLTFFVPIIIAILLMEMRKSTIRIMMILWFIPVAQIAGIMIWKWFYNVNYGLFNGILTSLGLPALGWLNDPKLAMLCLVLPGLIMFAPGLLYIASIQGIPGELYEAAHLEGAGLWQQIWYITLPRLRPIISMMLILAIIRNMQIFTQPFVMTGGGPGMATTTVVMYFFNLAFMNFDFGKASAVALILFIVIGAIIVIQRRYFKESLD